MQENLKPLPENISKEKLGQTPKDFSFDPFAESPMSKVISEYSIKVLEQLESEIFGACTQIALENGIKYEYAISKAFVVNAMKKAIPTKPTEQGEQKVKTLLGEMWLDNGKCPNCREKVVEFEKYCCECGQKLSWGDEDEPTTTDFEACQTDFD